jgi:hypothetical protein
VSDADKGIDELAEEDLAAEPENDKTEYIEFVGMPPLGTEFYKGDLGTHSIDRKHMKDVHDIDLGAKEVVWRKGANGRMLVPVADIAPAVVAYLETDPMFKRVTL